MPQYCAVPFCSEKKGGHKFPRNETVLEQWLQAIRRANLTPSNNSRVCKKHFTPDDYAVSKEAFSKNLPLKLKPEAVPSRFAWNNESEDGKEIQSKYSKSAERALQRQKKCDTATIYSNTEEKRCEELLVFEETCEDIIMEDSNKDISIQCSLCKCGEREENLHNMFRIKNIKDNHDIAQINTGFDNYDNFMDIYNLFGDDMNNLQNIPLPLPPQEKLAVTPTDQFHLTLVKLRRNMCYEELSFNFDVSISFVSNNYFTTWINYLFCKFKDLNVWAPKEAIEENVTSQNSCTTIYCTKTKIEKPQTPVSQQATFTNNKSAYTLKLLIGISASGSGSFITDAHGGSVSSIQLFEKRGIINQLQSEDIILGNSEFDVQDLSTHMDGQTKKISSECINFKHAIGLEDTFKILSKLSSNLVVSLGRKIIFVCFMLMNFRNNKM